MNHIVVFITCSDREEAGKISKALLDEKLAACVNMVPEIHSTYWWQGKIETSAEVFLMAKTAESKLDIVIAKVKELHSYDVPEVIALPIVGGNPDYLKWIDESIKE
ncbi:MAG: divalent-cation tolerance protein CutA [Endomicrobiales bacterium]|nr:divalent-cation tolerance protein CutA [Endomicrobiales bacterium]